MRSYSKEQDQGTQCVSGVFCGVSSLWASKGMGQATQEIQRLRDGKEKTEVGKEQKPVG